MYAPTRLEGFRILTPPTPGTQAEIALPRFRIGAALSVPELRQAPTAVAAQALRSPRQGVALGALADFAIAS
jgi:hypothetical protein